MNEMRRLGVWVLILWVTAGIISCSGIRQGGKLLGAMFLKSR